MMGAGNWRGGQGGIGGSLHEGHSTDSPGETNAEKSSKGKHSFWTASSHNCFGSFALFSQMWD